MFNLQGAGSAGIGVAQVLYQAMLEHGRTEEEARNCFFVADEKGLVTIDCILSFVYDIVAALQDLFFQPAWD